MSRITAIIVDDEPKAIEVLQRYANDTDLIEIESSFRDPVKAIDYLQNHKIDLVFLDINMPKLNGMEFLNVLDYMPNVIFTTAYTEYALESYNYKTIDYLLKPINFKRFLKALSKAQNVIFSESRREIIRSKTETEKIIYLKSGPQLHKIRVSDILYLEKDGNYLAFHTHEKKVISRQNMKDVFDILSPDEFIRIHKSFVVSIIHMEVIESHQVQIGQIKIPVGRNYREDLMKIAK